MSSPRQKLIKAANVLSKYYGLPVTQDLLSADALKAVTGEQSGTSGVGADKLLDTILANFINTSSGALTSAQLVAKMKEVVSESPEAQERLNKVLQIYFTADKLMDGTSADAKDDENREVYRPPISEIMQYEGASQGVDGTTINATPGSPTKDSPSLSVIHCNSHRIGLTGRDVNASVIFLNGIPNVEINRAVPFVDIEFFFAGPALDDHTDRIQSLSLAKFLVGAEKVDGTNSPLSALAQAGQTGDKTTNEDTGEVTDSRYSTAGMELFTSPQSLVNADAADSPQLHSAEILDKFRPLMTMQSFNVSVAPSTGLMSFKTADLKFILHDRSRLADIANFVRADLYGKSEILIEYGWSHPDGAKNTGVDNPYGDLINGMRVKEKYAIVNSSFTFDDSSQVIVTLKLAMKGAIDFDTELIASDSESAGNAVKEIQELQKLVGEYKDRLYKGATEAKIKEIRGYQVLETASDSYSQIVLGKKLRSEMNKFLKSLKKSSNPDAKALQEALIELFGEKGNGGAVGNLRKNITESITKKMKKLQGDRTDPFLVSTPNFFGRGGSGKRNIVRNEKPGRGKKKYEKLNENVSTGIKPGSEVSLTKILLNFVAEPLVNTGKFDDVQFVFYPFNDYAGAARKLNIGNFAVNLEFFTEEYQRYRQDHVSKSGNMTLSAFLNFLADIVLDDAGATAYGLFDTKGSFYKNVWNEDGTERSVEIAGSVPDYQQRLEKKLKEYGTPDGSWKQPNIEFFVESLPEAIGETEGQDSSANTSRTILRVHIFDQQATSYDTLQALLASTRTHEIEAITSAQAAPTPDSSNLSVEEENKRTSSAFLEAAARSGLLEPVKSENEELPTKYKILGSSRQLKEFIMASMPYIIYGTAGTTIKSANLSSMQDSKLASVNILRSLGKTELQPTGEDPTGLPMRIIPTELNLSTLGCPLINFAQQFFCDFQTNTTADSIYVVTGLEHSFVPGEFTSSIKLTPADAWGRYMSLVQRAGQASEVLKELNEENPFE